MFASVRSVKLLGGIFQEKVNMITIAMTKEFKEMKVKISTRDLIDDLEARFGNVFENIREDDDITKVELRYGEIEITIGED